MLFYSLRVHGELSEFQCALTMDTDILKEYRGIEYKYCVHESKQENVYEYLHGAPGNGIMNRCLKLPIGEFKKGNKIHAIYAA